MCVTRSHSSHQPAAVPVFGRGHHTRWYAGSGPGAAQAFACQLYQQHTRLSCACSLRPARFPPIRVWVAGRERNTAAPPDQQHRRCACGERPPCGRAHARRCTHCTATCSPRDPFIGWRPASCWGACTPTGGTSRQHKHKLVEEHEPHGSFVYHHKRSACVTWANCPTGSHCLQPVLLCCRQGSIKPPNGRTAARTATCTAGSTARNPAAIPAAAAA